MYLFLLAYNMLLLDLLFITSGARLKPVNLPPPLCKINFTETIIRKTRVQHIFAYFLEVKKILSNEILAFEIS